MKKISFLWMIACAMVLSLMTACMPMGGGGGVAYVGEASFEYSDDPSDCLLLTGTAATGEPMTIFGTKLSDGTPSSITGFDVTNQGDVAPTSITLENNLIKQVVAPNDVVMNLDWLSEGEVRVSLYDPNSGESLKTVIDKNSTKSVSVETASRPVCRNPLPGGSEIVEVPITTPQSEKASFSAITKADGSNPELTGKVITTSCGEPYMATTPCVYVYKADFTQKLLKRYEASYNALGYYEYILPAGVQPHNNISLANFVKGIDDLMGKICATADIVGGKDYFSTLFCPGVAASIAGLGMGTSTPAALAFLKACTATVAAFNVYCNTWGASASGDFGLENSPTPQVKEKIYSTLQKLDIEWDTPLYIEPRDVGSFGGPTIGDRILYESGSALPVAYLSVGDTPHVFSIDCSPIYPKAGQDYTIEAIIKCALEGSIVTITVEGTDGYEDKKEFTVAQSAAEKKFSMGVPGGEKGVRDFINVTLDTPDGKHSGLYTRLWFGKAD